MAEMIITGQDSTTGIQQTCKSGDTIYGGIGTLSVNTTDVGNIGTGEDDLMTYSLAAGKLAVDGQYIEGQAFGIFASNVNAKTIRAYFGSQKIFDSGLQIQSGGSWELRTTIIRTGATTQRAITSFITDTALFTDDVTYTTPTETLSGAVTVKCTAEAVANDDIIQKGFIVKYYA